MSGRKVAIVGVGYSTVGRRTGLTSRQLTTQSVKAALDDAGLQPKDIDGLATMATSADEVIDDAMNQLWMLGFGPMGWFSTSTAYSPAFSHPAMAAYAAVSSGLCETAMVIRTMLQQRTGLAFERPFEASEFALDAQFLLPFGGGAPYHWSAMMMQRYMAEYGVTAEQFGAHAVAKRRFATRNDDALLRDPLTVEQYMGSPVVSEPLRRLDCDYPCDVSSAVIFTTAERASDCRNIPVHVEAAALSATRDMNFELLEDMLHAAPHHCARQLWSRTSLTPGDVDVAELYDGFSVITFQWLEALGFCEPGGAGAFVAAGHTDLGGRLPLNTDGGACNVGRRHGANFCIEAVRQLRGQCGDRQVPGAEVAVFTNAVASFGGGMLLTRG
jgi:acetyl-CoA acetyltransferase